MPGKEVCKVCGREKDWMGRTIRLRGEGDGETL